MRQARWAGAVAVLLAALGCGSDGDPFPTPGEAGGGATVPRLRVTNGGATPIVGLSVLFPEDQIAFGDVAPGASTAYRDVPNGVYRYAAYRLEIDGAAVTQPVIDWVGEVPLDGEAFTYALVVNPRGSPFEIVTLVSVTRDR